MKTLSLLSGLILILFSTTSIFCQYTTIYWVIEDDPNGKIMAANIDGSNPTDLITGIHLPKSIAVDTTSTPPKIYFNESNASRILRANLDGTGMEEVVTGISGIRDIELDLINRKIYWAKNSFNDDRISRSDMDGINSNIEDLYTSTSTSYDFNGIGIDIPANKVYWTQRNNGGLDKIMRMNTNGTNVEIIIDNNDVLLLGLWDIDVVKDKIFWADPGLSEDRIMSANKDGSGIDTILTEVDALYFVADTTENLIYWAAGNKIERAGLDGTNRIALITGISSLAAGIALGNGSPIASVKQSAGYPSQYRLLQNYPNPFNPATTIRFELPKSAEIQLLIYDVLGQKVVTLVSKRMPAGMHEMFWNASDFPSGLYFYQLSAGKFKEVRKMLLVK